MGSPQRGLLLILLIIVNWKCPQDRLRAHSNASLFRITRFHSVTPWGTNYIYCLSKSGPPHKCSWLTVGMVKTVGPFQCSFPAFSQPLYLLDRNLALAPLQISPQYIYTYNFTEEFLYKFFSIHLLFFFSKNIFFCRGYMQVFKYKRNMNKQSRGWVIYPTGHLFDNFDCVCVINSSSLFLLEFLFNIHIYRYICCCAIISLY